MRRRDFLAASSALAAAPWAVAAPSPDPLLIGTTPVFLDDEVAFLRNWQAYLSERLLRPVRFVQRGTYREVTELLLSDQLDAAWVCGFPYMRYQARMRLVAVPLWDGRPLYRSYVIVHSTDTTTTSLGDLHGKIYAFSDPDSNSGWLVPQARLQELGATPATFFRKSFFTYAHRRVVDAVAARVAHAGSVDGYVWNTLEKLHPELTAQTRVVQRSEEFGFPPVVARSTLPDKDLHRLQSVLLAMKTDVAGLELLRRLNLDGFETGSPALFASIGANMRRLGIS